MTVIIPNSAYRLQRLGLQVKKSITPIAAATYDVFIASGGRVTLTSLTGKVTTQIGATTTNLSLVFLPDIGGSETMASAAAIQGDLVGQSYYILGSVSAPGVVQTGGVGGESNNIFSGGYTIDSGKLSATFSAIPGGGVIEWTATWFPYDDTAALVAA